MEFKRALSPNYANAHNWYAELPVDSRRFDESLRETYKARELDPLSPMMNISLACRLCQAYRCKDAMPVALAALGIDPNFALGHAALAVIYGDQGKSGEVIMELRRATELSDHNPNFVAWLVYAYAVTGDRSRTHALLNQLKQTSRDRYVAPYQLAKIYSGLGDKQRALQDLKGLIGSARPTWTTCTWIVLRAARWRSCALNLNSPICCMPQVPRQRCTSLSSSSGEDAATLPEPSCLS